MAYVHRPCQDYLETKAVLDIQGHPVCVVSLAYLDLLVSKAFPESLVLTVLVAPLDCQDVMAPLDFRV